MAHMTERKCQWCTKPFQARTADVNRGWAKFCTKKCKASEQEKRTGQNRAFVAGGGVKESEFDRDERMHQAALDSMSDSEYGASDGGLGGGN